MNDTHWKDFKDIIQHHLTDEDDPNFWKDAINKIYQDAEILCNFNPQKKWIETKIGCCKHWLRPHQTRWKGGGGFAWPTGYGGTRHSRLGYPQTFWSEIFYWHFQDAIWSQTDLRKRYLEHQVITFHVVLPNRTTQHNQAAIYTCWNPGTPPLPKSKYLQFYGFRQINDKWECVDVSGSDEPYNLAAENSKMGC